MVGWHQGLDGQEFEQAPGAGDGQGGLACCSPWGRKGSDSPEGVNSSNALSWVILRTSVSSLPMVSLAESQSILQVSENQPSVSDSLYCSFAVPLILTLIFHIFLF